MKNKSPRKSWVRVPQAKIKSWLHFHRLILGIKETVGRPWSLGWITTNLVVASKVSSNGKTWVLILTQARDRGAERSWVISNRWWVPEWGETYRRLPGTNQASVSLFTKSWQKVRMAWSKFYHWLNIIKTCYLKGSASQVASPRSGPKSKPNTSELNSWTKI